MKDTAELGPTITVSDLDFLILIFLLISVNVWHLSLNIFGNGLSLDYLPVSVSFRVALIIPQ